MLAAAHARVFGPLGLHGPRHRRRSAARLRAARLRILPEHHLAIADFGGVLAALVAAPLVAFAMVVGAPVSPGATVAIAAAAGVAVFFGTRAAILAYPSAVAASRARRIDAEFASVATLCYALSRGGVGVLDVFRAVAEERETYGEASIEFDAVLREIERVGKDVNSALQSVAATTPSARLRSFFEGLVAILNSGAEPRDYFRREAETLLDDAAQVAERDIDQAGMLGETYVSGLLVLPLLLIVVLTVLSALRDLGAMPIYLIIFLVIPAGTVAYLVIVDLLLPQEILAPPRPPPARLSDFGVASMPAHWQVLPLPPLEVLRGAPGTRPARVDTGRALSRRARFERRWRQTRAAWSSFVERAVERPLDALTFTGAPAAALLFGGVLLFWRTGLAQHELAIAATGLLLLSALIAFAPVAIFHELRVRRAREVDAALPTVLNRLAAFNEKGVSLFRSFQILGRSTPGELGREFRALDRDVRWTANLRGALRRMRARVSTRRLAKLGVLFERGTAATGDLKETLEIAAAEATVSEAQRNRRSRAMMSYLVVVYVVFAVFLYVVYLVTSLFYGQGGTTASSVALSGMGGGVDSTQARLLFFHAVLIQGVFCGVVAGRLGESHLLSGIKHAALMAGAAWFVFRFGLLA